jgi:hypothetical protein
MKRTYRNILDSVARQKVPDDINLFPNIATKLNQGKHPMQPRLKGLLTVLILLLALIVMTAAGYAYYHWMGDPGLQAVEDAGLVTDLDMTGQPTLLPTTPGTDAPQEGMHLNSSQTLAGVTVTLRWIYMDETRLAFGFDASLPEGMTLAQPSVFFPEIQIEAGVPSEYGIHFDTNQLAIGTYTSYQVIHAADVGGKLNINIDLPLVEGWTTDPALATAVANIHFEVKNVPIFQNQAAGTFQTQSITVNGITVTLESVSFTPSYTTARLCYEHPSDDPNWLITRATVQFGDSQEIDLERITDYYQEYPNLSCVEIGFPLGNSKNTDQLILRVRKLTVIFNGIVDHAPDLRIYAANEELAQYGIEIAPAEPGEERALGGWKYVHCDPDPCGQKDYSPMVTELLEKSFPGPWEFHVDLIGTEDIPGLTTATPIPPTPTTGPFGSRTIDNVNVTLDWIFADSKRVAIGYTITGLSDVPEATGLIGSINLVEKSGEVETGWGGNATLQRVEGKPGVLQGTWSTVFLSPLTKSETSFSIDFTLGSDNQDDFWNVIAGFPISPDATPYPPGVFPPALPDHKIGTFHFDVNAPVYPIMTLKPAQTLVNSFIQMRLEKVEITPSFTTVWLCYSTPSNADWIVARSELQAGNNSVQNDSYRLLYDAFYGGYQGLPPAPTDMPQPETGRCISLDFQLGHANIPGTMTLTIPALELSVPEVIPEDQIQMAQDMLRAQAIEVSYTTFSAAGGGGGGGPIFTKKPGGMTDEQAYQKLMDALGYNYPGPWVFEIQVVP